VIRSFANQATADVYVGRESRAARRFPKPIWPVVRRKLDVLHRARSVQDLRINNQYRITFRFEEGHAYEVACEDYH
jgi:proteic killer suppression protein